MVQLDYSFNEKKKRLTFFKNGKPTGGIIGELAAKKIRKLTKNKEIKWKN